MKKTITVLLMCLAAVMLAACGGGGKNDSPAEATEAKADMYRVIVKDEEGKPVQGVRIQFCSDQFCQMGETDAEGVAAFPDSPEGVYTAHVYSVPEGFAEDKTEYDVAETFGDLTITLKAAQ